MGLLEEEALIAEIGVILRALQIASDPPALPAASSPRAAGLAATGEGFAELLAEGGAAPPAEAVKRRLGPRYYGEAAAALLNLWREGRLPSPP
jgi:hypothetical protein